MTKEIRAKFEDLRKKMSVYLQTFKILFKPLSLIKLFTYKKIFICAC